MTNQDPSLLASYLMLVGLLGVYFLPAIVGRHNRNAVAIFALNLLLGWTLIGWVAALVWGLTRERVERPDCQ